MGLRSVWQSWLARGDRLEQRHDTVSANFMENNRATVADSVADGLEETKGKRCYQQVIVDKIVKVRQS